MKQIIVLFVFALTVAVVSSCKTIDYTDRGKPSTFQSVNPADCAVVISGVDEDVSVTIYGYKALSGYKSYSFDVWGFHDEVIYRYHLDQCDSVDVYFKSAKATARLFPATANNDFYASHRLERFYEQIDNSMVFSINTNLKKIAH